MLPERSDTQKTGSILVEEERIAKNYAANWLGIHGASWSRF